jgi:hypothetical protein
MKFEDFLKTRNITDDSTDEELRKAVDIKMFGVTFSRYLSNASTIPEDFRSALEFIELIGYTNKLILPGQTYRTFILTKALARRITLDPVPTVKVESPTTPGQAKTQTRQEEMDRTPRASTNFLPRSPSPRILFTEPDSPPLGELPPPRTPHYAPSSHNEGRLQEPAEIKRLSLITDDSQQPESESSYDTASENLAAHSPLEEWQKNNQTYHWYKFFVREFPYTFGTSEYQTSPPSIRDRTQADAAAVDFQAYINVQVTLLPENYISLTPAKVQEMTSKELGEEYLYTVRTIRTAIDYPTGYVGDIVWKRPHRFPATVQKLRNLHREILRRAEPHLLDLSKHHRYLEGPPNHRSPSVSPRPNHDRKSDNSHGSQKAQGKRS